MMQPRLYVVDEPLANLDPATAERLLLLLRELADRGDAVVIVEHRVEEALELRPDRVLYLDDGRERYQGPLDGFLKIADPEAVKLPFSVVLERVRAGATPDGRVPPDLERPVDRSLPPRLEFRGVRAGYGGREVLRGIDARFERREIVAVLGPNGSGKTTLFRTAMHLMPVTAGEVLVDGRSIADRKVADLATVFGYVFQSPSQMLFARTVREELVFGPRNLGRDPATFDAIIDDVLRRTSLDGLEDIRERPPLTLSFGQQKRLALAIALALQPPTLILDEPSAGQDHRTSAAVHAGGPGDPWPREPLSRNPRRGPCIDARGPYPAVSRGRGGGGRSAHRRHPGRGALGRLQPPANVAAPGESRVAGGDGRFLSAEALARRVIEGDRPGAGTRREVVERDATGGFSVRLQSWRETSWRPCNWIGGTGRTCGR